MVANNQKPQPDLLRPHKIVIVGAGQVGTTFAYSLLLKGTVGQIVLIDIDHDRAEGEAMDLNHGVPLSNTVRIWAGDYPDCAGADIVVITAGTAQRPGETRLDLVKRNVEIFRQIVPRITQYAQNAVLLIATNPVDILSQVTQKFSGFPAGRVLGSGTILDTARFRFLLGEHLGIDPRNVHAYIIGEHGDSEVPVWSMADVAGMRLKDFCQRAGCSLTTAECEHIFEQTRDAAYEIIKRKGATYYAVAVGLLQIVESILKDQHTVLTVSSQVPNLYGIEDLYLSLPAVVGRYGVERVLHLPLNEIEHANLRKSASILSEVVQELDL
ncbi:MAG: L-lactate dehydrogenase [Anaerolineaceae bacterium]|nr:L-lactate dehydrogenase [Anaerolineaceae bacterium]